MASACGPVLAFGSFSAILVRSSRTINNLRATRATADESRRRLHAGRLIYPEVPDPLTSADLKRFFSPSYAERKWAPTIARWPTSQVVLLVQLKVFQTVGRFLNLRTVPRLIVEHVAHRFGIDGEIGFESSESTQYRHRKAILDRLGVTAWARRRGDSHIER
jgi:hypothetical protein